MTEPAHWESMYEKPLEQIPWEIGKPPRELVQVLENGLAKPCKALDIGCGTGNYAIYLAKQGFDVTGVDVSENALKIAKEKAGAEKVAVRFLRADALELAKALKGEKYGFILDYSLLHHIPHRYTRAYARQFNELLNVGGKLLLVCYSEEDEQARGRTTVIGKYGNEMNFRKAQEIRRAYSGLTPLYYKKCTLGKRDHHAGHCFLFQKSPADNSP